MGRHTPPHTKEIYNLNTKQQALLEELNKEHRSKLNVTRLNNTNDFKLSAWGDNLIPWIEYILKTKADYNPEQVESEEECSKSSAEETLTASAP